MMTARLLWSIPTIFRAFVCTRRERFQAEMYTAGEELFALRNTQHPELVKTKKETCLLDQLYGLYMDVVHTLERCGNCIVRINPLTKPLNKYTRICLSVSV